LDRYLAKEGRAYRRKELRRLRLEGIEDDNEFFNIEKRNEGEEEKESETE
jgi:hypothetical protein